MKPFAYERATDTGAAVALAGSAPGARYLAGGTNLIDLMKLEVETPDLLIDVRDLGHDAIEAGEDGGLRIGAGVSNSALAADRGVRERYPVLAQALLAGASGQLRNAPALYTPEKVNPSFPSETGQGDPDGALAAAAASVDATYTTPAFHNNPMEPHATVAVWEHGGLRLYDLTQGASGVASGIANLPGSSPRRCA